LVLKDFVSSEVFHKSKEVSDLLDLVKKAVRERDWAAYRE
jgi:hypothetical protein